MKLLLEMNDYRKLYGSSAVKGTILFGANCLSYALNRQPFYGPFYVGWDITFRCNARCGYCDRWKHADVDELTTEQCIEAIDDLAGLRTWLISFGGGETLLRRDIFELIAYAREKGILVNVDTNGALLEDHAAELIEADVNSITVSVDSDNEAFHDAQRMVPGLFKKARSGIRKVKRLRTGSTPELKVRAVVTGGNQYRLDTFYHFWVGEVDTVVLQPVHCDPEALFNDHDPKVDAKDLGKMMQKLGSMDPQFRNAYNSRFKDFFRNPEEMSKEFTCFAGYFTAQIDARGDVYACTGYKDRIGSLKDDSFENIWTSTRSASNRKKLRRRGNECFCWFNCNGTLNCYLSNIFGGRKE